MAKAKKSKDKTGARKPAPKAAVKPPVARPPAARVARPASKPATSAAKPTVAASKTSPTPGKAAPPMTTRKPEPGKSASGSSVPPSKPGTPKPAQAKAAPSKPALSKPALSKPAGAKPVGNGRPAVPGRAPLTRSAVAARLAARDEEEKEKENNRLKKSPYSKRDLQPMRTALLSKRLQLVGALDKLGNEALRADEPDTDSEDVADHGTDAFERNMTLGLMENEARTLQQIEEALEQMATGRYGVCTQCGSAIPLVRLTALPFATTCVPCQEKAERRL
jgi:DnaK suppressor protein